MSLLLNYVSDKKNDGTYTLDLNEAETRALWDKIDALEAELQSYRDAAGRPDSVLRQNP